MAILEGQKVNLGGRDFVVPPLNLRALRILGPRFAELSQNAVAGVIGPDQIDTMIEVVHAAMVRNYPEITKEELEDLLDMGNIARVFQAVAAQSGMKQAPSGEA
jgi:hypothetical protein